MQKTDTTSNLSLQTTLFKQGGIEEMRMFCVKLNRLFLSCVLLFLCTFIFLGNNAGATVYDTFSDTDWSDKWVSYYNGAANVDGGKFSQDGSTLNFSSNDSNMQTLIAKMAFTEPFSAAISFSDVSITGTLDYPPTMGNSPLLGFVITKGNDRITIALAQYQYLNTYYSFLWAGEFLNGSLSENLNYTILPTFISEGSLGFYYDGTNVSAYYSSIKDANAGDPGWVNLLIVDISSWDSNPLYLGITGTKLGNSTDGTFSFKADNARFQNRAVPEPATMLLLGLGLLGLAGMRKKFKK